MWWMLLRGAWALGIPALSGLIEIEQPGEVTVGDAPTFTLRVPDAEVVFLAECEIEGKTDKQTVTSPVLDVGASMSIALDAQHPVSSAECVLVANFANGLSERRSATISWTWVEPQADQ